jgi:signal transduction histidine kinase/PAS domain-containing protein
MEGHCTYMNTENVSPTTAKGNDIAQISLYASSRHLIVHMLQKGQRWLAAHTYTSAWVPVGLRSWFVGYTLAIALQILVLFLIKLLIPIYPVFNFIEAPVLLVVLCISFVWGIGPGILATVTGTLLLILLMLSPYFPPEVRKLEDGVSIILYLGIGLISGSMISQARRMQTDALLVRQKGLEENTQQLYDLFRQVPIPISVLRGPEYRFEFINPLTQQAIGKREVLGKSIREALPEYAGQGIFHLLDQVYMTGEPMTIRELRAETLHYDDGLPVPIEHYYNVVYQPLRTEQGVVDGIMIFNIDITEQVLTNKQKEQLTQEREQERDHLRTVLVHEQELRLVAENATRQLQTILEVLPLGVTITDANGRILQRNATAFQIWGKQPLNPEGLTEYRSDVGKWADTGKPLGADEWPLARALMKGEVSHNTEIDVISFDGEQKTLLYFAAPMRNEQGEITGGVAAGLDITQRKQLELRLRETEQQTRESLHALLVLAEALVSAPITDIVEAAHPAPTPGNIAQRLALLIRSVLNCKRVSITVFDPRTHEPRSLAVVGLPPELEQVWREQRPGFYLSDQIGGSTFEAQFARGNVVVVNMQDPSFAGQANPYDIQIMLLAPMRIGTQLIGILALDHAEEAHGFTDAEKSLAKAVAELAALILERERLLTERAESQANVLALQEANHLKDEFIGIAGHELRTPLTTVKASVQLTRRQVTRLLKLEPALSPEAAKLITTMQNLLDRAERQIGMQNRLVNDLLDISRIETGRLELHPELCDLVPFVHEVVEDQQALTPERHIVFEQDAHEEALVLVDADRLRQVITNYLSNALKYSANDQPVFVRIALLETEVRVEVEDRGQGLTETQQEHIWERFYRVPGIEVKSGSGVGLGLGLHISRMIIERHNGNVGVRSIKGQGSVFWLTMPRAE